MSIDHQNAGTQRTFVMAHAEQLRHPRWVPVPQPISERMLGIGHGVDSCEDRWMAATARQVDDPASATP